MASTYVNDLRLNEMATGDESGNWGNVTNTNLELIGEALGYGTEAISTNADTHTSTIADGGTDPVRAMYVKYTGSLDSACTITIDPNTINRMHFIENATSGSQNIIISQGSGANVTIPNGDVKAVYLDGAGSGAAVVDAFASLNVVDLKVEDDLTVTDDVTIGGATTIGGVLDITDTTDSSDATGDTGALRTEGGASIAKKLYVGTDLDVDGTANLDIVDIDGAVDMASTLQVDGAITSSAGATITVADNSDNLTLTSTDADASAGPNLRMYRNSGSPADSDSIGLIQFEGRNDNSQDVVYAAIDTRIVDASDGSEDGRLELTTVLAGTEGISRLFMDGTETVFNDNSQDLDFRVESNGNANTLIVDGGTDEVRVPHNIAAQSMAGLIVRDNGASIEYGHQNNGGQYYGTLGSFGSNGDPYIGFATDCESSANTFTTRGSKGCLITNGSGDMRFMAVTSASATGQTPAERVRILNDGGMTFNGDTAAANALDDYEEGSFDPLIIAGTTNPTGGGTTREGHYVKIGRQVWVSFYVGVSYTNSPAGGVYVSNLPFTIANNADNTAHVPAITYNFAVGSAETPFLATQLNSTNLRLYMMGAGAWGAGDFSSHVTSPLYISAQVTYFV